MRGNNGRALASGEKDAQDDAENGKKGKHGEIEREREKQKQRERETMTNSEGERERERQKEQIRVIYILQYVICGPHVLWNVKQICKIKKVFNTLEMVVYMHTHTHTRI